MNPLYKFEFNLAVVEYLLRAANAQQTRGEQQARDLLTVLDLLRKPKNAEDLEKEQLESLKEKYEPIDQDASEEASEE